MTFMKAFTAWLDLREAELRTGFTLIEAVAAEEANIELLACVGSEQAAAEVRQMALELAKCGVRLEDVEPMVRQYMVGNTRLHAELYGVKQRIDRIIIRTGGIP